MQDLSGRPCGILALVDHKERSAQAKVIDDKNKVTEEDDGGKKEGAGSIECRAS